MADLLHSSDLLEAASSVDDQSSNDQATNEQTSNVHLTNDHFTNDKSNNDQATNEHLPTDQSSNDQITSNQSTNDQSTNEYSTNDKANNYQSTNDQSSNDQLTYYHSKNEQSSNDQSRNDRKEQSSSDQSSNDGSVSFEFSTFLDSPEELSSDDDRFSCDESSSDESEFDQNMDFDLLSSELLQAACSGNVKKVTDVLDKFSVDKSKSKYSRAAVVNVKNKGGDTALFLALSQGEENVMAVRTLVSAGADINTFNKLGQTPLVHALFYCSLGFIRELIQLGADVNQHTTYGYSPLLIGIGREDCLPLLIEAGADLNAQFYVTNGFCSLLSGQTALMQAVYSLTHLNLNCVKLLLQAGANVNVINDDGETALCIAVWQIINTNYYSASDATECLRLLINYGADVNSRNAQGDTAFMHMARSAYSYRKNQVYTKVISILIADAEANLNMKTSDGETALMLAIKAGTTKNQYHDPLFMYPAITRFVELFIKAKADVMSTNTAGQTALMYAVKDDNLVSLLSILVNAGTDIDHQDSSGMTALSHAISSRSIQCACWLVESGADITKKNINRETTLMQAARDDFFDSLLSILVKAGTDIDQQDSSGMTALTHAIRNGSLKCACWLVECGANVTKINVKGETALMQAAKDDFFVSLLPILVKAGAATDQQDFSGMTALTHADSKRSLRCVRWLINFGVSVNIQDNSGKTPLHYLMLTNNSYNAKQCLEVLLSKLSDVNVRDNEGMTLLMYVAKYQSDNWITNKLLEHGAELNIVDNKGQTALIHSLGLTPHPDDVLEKNDRRFRRTDYKENVKFLLNKGADFSVGQLAEGQLARLGPFDQDRSLIKLRVGNDVDLEVPWDNFVSVVTEGSREFLQFLILNGVMPLTSTMACKLRLRYANGRSPSVLEVAVVRSRTSVMTTKYLIATCYLRSVDLTSFIDTSKYHVVEQQQAVTIIGNLRSQPWPLVKLCFVVVSTAFGASPGRQERVKNSQLPPKLQRMLLFQENVSRLCVHQWDKIPLTFSPEDYENLPQPRPLLYNWPVGRALVPCDCGYCDGTMYKYDQEEEDTENGGE